MVSDELLEFWFFVLGVIVCIIAVALFIILIDRSRRAGPFHFVGYALMSAHAWQTGQMILDGEVGGLARTPLEVQQLARERVKEKERERAASLTTQLDEKQLDAQIDLLQKRKEELSQETEQVIP